MVLSIVDLTKLHIFIRSNCWMLHIDGFSKTWKVTIIPRGPKIRTWIEDIIYDVFGYHCDSFSCHFFNCLNSLGKVDPMYGDNFINSLLSLSVNLHLQFINLRVKKYAIFSPSNSLLLLRRHLIELLIVLCVELFIGAIIPHVLTSSLNMEKSIWLRNH